MYPAVPKSTPIYAVVDVTKKKCRSKFDAKEGSKDIKSESNLPDLVTLRPSDIRPGPSDLSERQLRDLGQVSNDELGDNDLTEDCRSVTEENTEYLSDHGDDTTLTTSEELSSQAMVKSHSANHSPNFDDLCVSVNPDKVKHHKKKKIKKHKKEVTDTGLDHEIGNNGNHSERRRGKII